MKVLLIGGTGTLSADTTRLCIARGYEVYLINRGHRNHFNGSNIQYLIGDINDEESAVSAIGEHRFDVVVDYLTYTLDILKLRIKLFKNRTKQYIFISSATVYPVSSQVISEKDPIGNKEWIYSRNKQICEEYLMENADKLLFHYTIVRPYITYDCKRIPFPIISKNSNWNLLYRIENELPILIPDDGDQRVTLTSTKDFAVGITGLFLNEKAYEEVFNVVGDEVVSWNEVVRIIENKLGKKAVPVYVNARELSERIPGLAGELLCDKAHTHIFDNRKLQNTVPEFVTAVKAADGIGETIDYLQKEESLHVVDQEWNAVEDILCKRYGCKNVKITFRKRWSYFRKQNKFVLFVKKIIKRHT